MVSQKFKFVSYNRKFDFFAILIAKKTNTFLWKFRKMPSYVLYTRRSKIRNFRLFTDKRIF